MSAANVHVSVYQFAAVKFCPIAQYHSPLLHFLLLLMLLAEKKSL
jgi:hypothetical protein